jgi:flagellar protein FlbD
MITLHRLNKQEFVLNADLIETVESTPDTLVTLLNGKKIIVRDQIQDLVGKVIAYRQLCHGSIQVVHADKKESAEVGPAASATDSRPAWRKNQ